MNFFWRKCLSFVREGLPVVDLFLVPHLHMKVTVVPDIKAESEISKNLFKSY